MPVSTRYGIDYPLGTEAPDIDGDILKVVNGIESLAAQFGQGTLAARPISTPGSPGKQGRFYVVNSGAELGQMFYDYGTGWIHLNPDQTPGANSITSAMIQDNAVGSSEIAADAIGDSELADNVVSAAHLVNALKPSTGAGGATEALRALGTGAANAAAGNDARLSDQRTPADNSVTSAKIAANAVTPGDAKLDAAETWNFLGILQSKSMRTHRHPYGNDRHIEVGSYSMTNIGNQSMNPVGQTFVDPYGTAPIVVTNYQSSAQGISSLWRTIESFVDDVTTAGFTFWMCGGDIGSFDGSAGWIAEGAD